MRLPLGPDIMSEPTDLGGLMCLLRLAQAEVRVAAMDPNVRGVVLGLLVSIIACGVIYAGGYGLK